MNDSYQSVEVTVNGLKVKVITYSVGMERIVVVDRYDDITDKEIVWLTSYLEAEGFLFSKTPYIDIVKSA